jgi:hypothetical protein
MKNLKITMIYRGKTVCLCHARLGAARSDKIIFRIYKKMLAPIFGIWEKGASPLWR